MKFTSDGAFRVPESDPKVPVFLPIIETGTGAMAGSAVLTGREDAGERLNLPRDFSPPVEECGPVNMLADQVFRDAFRSASVAPAPQSLTVRMSPIQLRDLGLPSRIQQIAKEEGFPMDNLVFEISEIALLDDMKAAGTIFRELKAMGCALALDDFATRYSCLSHLEGPPLRGLKIARNFVHSAAETPKSNKFVAAVAGLAQTLALGSAAADSASVLAQSSSGAAPRIGSPLKFEPSLRLAQLRAIYDCAPVGLCTLDRDLHYVSINQRLATMHGNSVSAHIGRSVQEMYPKWYPSYEPYLLRTLQGEATAGVEVIQTGAAGMDWPMRTLVSYQPVHGEGDTVIGVSVSVVNLSGSASGSAAASTDLTHELPIVDPVLLENFQATWRRTSFAEN